MMTKGGSCMEHGYEGEFGNVIDFIDQIDYSTIRLKQGALVDEGQAWNLSRHSHEVIEIIYLIDAKACIDTHDKMLYPTWCDMVVYPPYHVHQEYIDMNASQKCMYIQIDVKSKVDLSVPFQVKDIEGKLYWLLSEVVKLSQLENTDERAGLIEAYMKAMFINIKLSLTSFKERDDILMQAMSYIRYNYSEDLTVDRLARMFYVSPSYISRLFHKKIGITPMNYVANIRIEAAKKLLCFSEVSINEIASMIGIEDPKYFSRLFKKVTQKTPTEFRKMSSE